MTKKIVNLMPLLDILMICIFWFIMNSNSIIESNQKENNDIINNQNIKLELTQTLLDDKIEISSELQQNIEELQTENKRLSKLLSKENNYLLVQLQGNSLDDRKIKITDDEQLISHITLKDYNTDFAKTQLTQTVETNLLNAQNSSQKLTIIVMFDGPNVLYKDYIFISNTLNDLLLNYSFIIRTTDLSK